MSLSTMSLSAMSLFAMSHCSLYLQCTTRCMHGASCIQPLLAGRKAALASLHFQPNSGADSHICVTSSHYRNVFVSIDMNRYPATFHARQHLRASHVPECTNARLRCSKRCIHSTHQCLAFGCMHTMHWVVGCVRWVHAVHSANIWGIDYWVLQVE